MIRSVFEFDFTWPREVLRRSFTGRVDVLIIIMSIGLFFWVTIVCRIRCEGKEIYGGIFLPVESSAGCQSQF